MLSRWIRTWYGSFLRPIIRGLDCLHITPNALTLAGLAALILAGVLLALGQMWAGVAALLVGQIFDTLDGELARQQANAAPFGAFLDSICDHCGDFAVYLGLTLHLMKTDARLDVVLILVALFGSVFGSQVRSRAGMLGINTKEIGAFTRFERTVVLVAGILINQLTAALWVLAVFNNLSALQRIIYTVRAARRPSRTPGRLSS